MKMSRAFATSALAGFTVLAALQARADNMASIAIAPTTGVVTLTPRWSIGGSLAGFHLMTQDTGFSVGANNFYSIKSTTIPAGGDIAAFTYYIAASGFATNQQDVGSKLTPSAYSALTSADPDVGYGSVNFYLVHHKGTTDYFTVIVPGSGTSSAVTDLKPMSGPGGPATITGVNGYFGLTFAAANLGYGLDLFYYLRTDPVTGSAKFGTLDPALLGTATDKFDLGINGYNALEFTGTDVGFGTDKMYYLRLDPVTGFTILGTLNPLTGRAADIANLGSVYTPLNFVAGDVGFGVNQFYTTGVINPTWQSVSFAAIAGRKVTDGSFTVSPSASSGGAITLTVVTGSASISGPVAGVFTVTPNAPGLITLQATQAGQPGLYEANMLRQSFVATIDFNSDGMTDILWQNSATGDRTIWLMNGTALASQVYLAGIPIAWQITGTGDFNGDGQPDIVWENTSTGDRSIWLMNGTSLSSFPYLAYVDPVWHIAAVGDFNGDGEPDLLWENTSTGDRAVWFLNGTQLATLGYLANVSTDWRIVGAADLNGDGQNDIIWENTATGDRSAWLMTGTTISSFVYMGNVAPAWHIAVVADFDGDGQPDLLWENTTTGDRAFWLMKGTTHTASVYLAYAAPVWHIAP